jgi:integrase
LSSIAKRPDGRWRARYRDQDNREHSKHFARKVDAQRWLDEVTAAVVTGQYVDPRSGRTWVREYAAAWEGQQIGRAASASIVDNALRLHVLPVLGDRPMASVRPSDVQALIRRLADGGMAPRSIRNIYDVTARMFAAAVDDRVIPASPCRRITLPRAEDVEVVPPTLEQVVALAEGVPARYRALVVLLAGSGLRIGEALGLVPGDVDFLRRTVRVERQRLQSGDLGPPKTGQSVRTVPLGQVVIDELAAHLAAGYGASESLFTAPDGAPLTYRAWKAVWRSAAPTRLTTHGLRHFFASALIAGGASVKQVQVVLGHSSAVITLRTYSHLWPGDDDRTRSVMDAALDILRTGCGPNEQGEGVSAGQ